MGKGAEMTDRPNIDAAAIEEFRRHGTDDPVGACVPADCPICWNLDAICDLAKQALAHDREVAAKALENAAGDYAENEREARAGRTSLLITQQWLRARAAKIREGEL
jgi:hypothetical protein